MNTDLTMVRRPECDACAGLLAVAASVATVCLAYHAALGQDANRIEANSGLFGVRVIATYRPDDRAERWEPRAITVSESGGLLFVVDASRDALFVHVRNRENGKLKLIRTFQGSQSQLPLEGATALDGLLSPSGMAASTDLATSCVSARASDSLFVFSGDASVGIRSEVQRIRNGMDGVRGLDDPQQVVFSPDEKSVYVVCPGADAIVVFERNPKTGKLLFVQCIQSSATQSLVSGSTVVNGLLRPTQLAVSPDGLNVYVTGFKDNSLCCFSRDVNIGELAHIETHQDVLVDGFYRGKKHGLVMANAVSVSPDGKNVYVGTVPGKLGAWERSKADGTVVFMESLGNNTDGFWN